MRRSKPSEAASSRPLEWSAADAWVLLPIVLATLWVYSNVGGFGFLSYDDPLYVSQNPWVHAGLTLEGIGWSFTTFDSFNWHPMTWLSLMLDVSLFGIDPGAIHRTNVALHVANLILVHVVMRQLGANAIAAGFVAGLFALHPLHVESVAWISERKGLVSTLFGLASMSLYIRWTGSGARLDRVGCMLLLAAGLAAKPMLVSWPVLLLLLDWGPLGRIRDAHLARDAIDRVREKLDLIALATASSVLTVLAQRAGGAVIEMERLGFGARLENALSGYARYLQLTFWPAGLAVVHPHPSGGIALWITIPAGVILVGTTVGVIMARRRIRPITVGWLWFVISLVPVIGIVQVGGQSIAERYTYVPLLGIFAAIAWAGSRAWQRPMARPALASLALGSLLVFGVVAERQVQHWRSSFALFSHTVAVTAPNYVARLHLGDAFIRAGDAVRALAEYRKAAELVPSHRLTVLGLSSALSALGRVEEATATIARAVATDPTWAEGHAQLGVMQLMQRDFTSSRSSFARAIELAPGLAVAHNGMGASIASLGDPQAAIPYFERAVRLRPSYAEAARNLDAARRAAGRR